MPDGCQAVTPEEQTSQMIWENVGWRQYTSVYMDDVGADPWPRVPSRNLVVAWATMVEVKEGIARAPGETVQLSIGN